VNSVQALIDGLSAQWQRERAETQITLGQLIERLEQMPSDLVMHGLEYAHSYRGYYSDLAFEECESTTVGELLKEARAAMGKRFEGYKGGDFWMTGNTPVWVAEYGSCGLKLIAINDDGTIETAEDK